MLVALDELEPAGSLKKVPQHEREAAATAHQRDTYLSTPIVEAKASIPFRLNPTQSIPTYLATRLHHDPFPLHAEDTQPT